VSFLEREITDLDAAPRVTTEDIGQVKAANKRVQDLLGALDAKTFLVTLS